MKGKVYKMKVIHWNSGDVERSERGWRWFLKNKKKDEIH